MAGIKMSTERNGETNLFVTACVRLIRARVKDKTGERRGAATEIQCVIEA